MVRSSHLHPPVRGGSITNLEYRLKRLKQCPRFSEVPEHLHLFFVSLPVTHRICVP